MISSVLDIMTPILLAAIGGLFTELSGALAICLEGLIAIGAFTSAAVAIATGNSTLAIACGAVASLGVAAAYAWFNEKTQANSFISALAVNLFSIGVTGLIALKLFGSRTLPRLPAETILPRIADHNILAWLAWCAVPLAWFLLSRTRFGLRLRASGSGPEALATHGVRPSSYRIASIAIAGLLCGLAGAWISLSTGSYAPGSSGGKGWIALVAIFLGFRRPFGVAIACVGFAFAEYLSNIAQASSILPDTVLLALPYAITLIAFIAYSATRRAK